MAPAATIPQSKRVSGQPSTGGSHPRRKYLLSSETPVSSCFASAPERHRCDDDRMPLHYLKTISSLVAGWESVRSFLDKALVRHPSQGVDLAELPVKLDPGVASIGAEEDLSVNAAGQQEIGVCGMGGKVPDRPVGFHR